jgi:hypothetical protein
VSEFGAPGKIPPALTGTASWIPKLEEWDPEGDIQVPLIGSDALYVPTIVRAPPQLPRPEEHPRTLDFPPRGIEAFFTPANVGLSPGRQLNFTAHSVQVDNYSNQWIFFPSGRRFIPPGSVGWIVLILPGAELAQWVQQAPGAHAAGTVGAATDVVLTVWHEAMLPPAVGVNLTV